MADPESVLHPPCFQTNIHALLSKKFVTVCILKERDISQAGGDSRPDESANVLARATRCKSLLTSKLYGRARM